MTRFERIARTVAREQRAMEQADAARAEWRGKCILKDHPEDYKANCFRRTPDPNEWCEACRVSAGKHHIFLAARKGLRAACKRLARVQP
jgi:hypothetical protein